MLEMGQAKIGYGVFLLFTLAYMQLVVEAAPALNNRPVIGILAQKPYKFVLKYGNEYVLSDYVKYLEMAGASVVVVKGEQPTKYYEDVFKRINGILLPGGGVDLVTSPFAKASRILYDMAIDANDKGDYFPIWGTCQGFQMLTVLAAKKNLLQQSDSENMSLPLDFMAGYNQSRLFGTTPKEIIDYLANENITANFHRLCLTKETFMQQTSLNTFYQALSVNKDRNGKEFVSTMEAFRYPFFGTQWHPEKNIFSKELAEDVSHSFHAIEVSQYMANFFVNQARKNFHKFSSEDERSHDVIENDHRVYTPYRYYEGYFYNVTKS